MRSLRLLMCQLLQLLEARMSWRRVLPLSAARHAARTACAAQLCRPESENQVTCNDVCWKNLNFGGKILHDKQPHVSPSPCAICLVYTTASE